MVRNRDHGIQSVNIREWRYFPAYVDEELLDYPSFIYRGHAAAHWVLEPTLDRILRTRGQLVRRTVRAKHLEAFQFAVRGRRGSNPPHVSTENDWWALGQHQGLATPLLDWTHSPYVAAYFAYEEPRQAEHGDCGIYAIDTTSFEKRSRIIERQSSGPGRPFVVEFIRPLSDESASLVSQSGLFTRAPDGIHLEEWVRSSFPRKQEEVVFIKIVLPSKDRTTALRALNRMNINRLSLFPDLSGASRFCNLSLQIDKY